MNYEAYKELRLKRDPELKALYEVTVADACYPLYRRQTESGEYVHFTSHFEAEVVGDNLGIVTGPTQVYCTSHGWTDSGIGDVCSECEEEWAIEDAADWAREKECYEE